MNPGGWLVIIEPSGRDEVAGGPGIPLVGRCQVAYGHRVLEKREHSLLCVELAPPWRGIGRHHAVPDEQLPIESGRRATELRGACIVHPCQRSSEVAARGG